MACGVEETKYFFFPALPSNNLLPTQLPGLLSEQCYGQINSSLHRTVKDASLKSFAWLRNQNPSNSNYLWRALSTKGIQLKENRVNLYSIESVQEKVKVEKKKEGLESKKHFSNHCTVFSVTRRPEPFSQSRKFYFWQTTSLIIPASLCVSLILRDWSASIWLFQPKFASHSLAPIGQGEGIVPACICLTIVCPGCQSPIKLYTI